MNNLTERVQIETASYNERRYSKPWIANVSVKDNKLSYEFGQWIGEPGSKGLLILDAKSEVYAKGQKDNRGNNTEISFYLTNTGEKIDRVDAFKKLAPGDIS